MRKVRLHIASDGTESWRVRYRPQGSATEKSETFYDETEAVEWSGILHALGAARALAWLDEKEKSDHLTTSITYGELWAKWYDWKSKPRPDGTPRRVKSWRTLDDYTKQYARHIKPRFENIPADMISAKDVGDWIEDLSASLNAKTVADYHALFHSVFKWALHPARRLILNDPCTDTELPSRAKRSPKGLWPQQWAVLYAAAIEVNPNGADLLAWMLASQWRWSEAVAVQAGAVQHWVDEWTEDGELLRESFTYVRMGRVQRREVGGTVFVDDEGKSDAAKRTVRMTGQVEEIVLRRLAGKQDDELLFTNEHGRSWNYAHFHSRVWKRPPSGKPDHAPKKKRIVEVAVANGFDRPDVTLHWLRHTGVAFLILSGEPLSAIQKRVGHASIKTTSDVYGGLVDDTSRRGLDALDRMMSGLGPRGRALAGPTPPSLTRSGSGT